MEKMTTPNSDLENYQTDVESIDDSSLNASSLTRLSCSSITDFNFGEEDVQALLDSQFSTSTVGVGAPEETVQEWVNKSEEACGSNSQALSQTDFDPTPSEQIQKMAAALLDGIENANEFNQEAWLQESEDDHQVPSGDVAKNFIEDTKIRLTSALMNLLNVVFIEAPLNATRCFYTEVLYCAAERISGPETCPPRKEFLNDANFEDLCLKSEYFSKLHLSFKQMPKQKQPIVRAVQDMVNESIVRAYDSKNAMLFSGYAMIPDKVQKCNADKGLGYNPDQVARYGIRLQKAVFQEMTARCLDLLALAGFKLKPMYLKAAGVYLSSNDSQTNQPFSLSQCSQSQDDDDVQSTFSSQGSMPPYETESNASQGGSNAVDPAIHDLQHSPGFVEYAQEYVRGNFLQNGSPGGSWGSNYSETPPQYSIPEQEPELNDLENENCVYPVVLEHSNIQMDLGLSSLSSNHSVRSDSSDEGPRRRRPRLEVE